MRKLAVYNNVTLDGYIAGENGDISWHNKQQRDPEWEAFGASNASGESALLFGRITYDLMKRFWTTPMAASQFPVVARQMNDLPKVVFSKTLKEASWSNSRLLKGELIAETKQLKAEPGPDLVILGSGSIVAQLTQANLIDEFQIVLFPVALGAGRTMFEGLRERVPLELVSTRTFANGNLFLKYAAVRKN